MSVPVPVFFPLCSRAVAVPQQVTSLALVSVAGGPSVPAYLHPALRYFHGRNISGHHSLEYSISKSGWDVYRESSIPGAAGVGTVGGRVYLVDLALDETGETSDSQPANLSLLHKRARRDIPGYVDEDSGRPKSRSR